MKKSPPSVAACVDDVRSILDGLTQAIVATDRDGLITALNPAAERLRGMKAEVAIGQPLRDLFVLLDADTREEVRLPLPASLHRDPAPRQFARAMLLTEADVPDVMVDAVISPVRDARGRWAGCVLSLIDIREAVIRERGIVDRQRMETIRAMAANMARDFSNWLSVISGHTAAIMESVIPQTRAHEAAVKILEATKQASGLMKRLLTVARAEKAERAEVESVHTQAVLQETVNLARATFLGSTIALRLRHSREAAHVAANGIQLLSCLMNLIRNSKEAMPQGGTITLETAARTIGKKTYVVVAVRDTGIGMSRETLQRIFTPFFSTKGQGVGMGIGLTVVRALVESWGGFVRVRSDVGRGTSVQLFLPRAAKPAATPSPTPAPAKGQTILVADDRPEVLAGTRQVFESAGFRVLTAATGRECLDIYRQQPDRVALVVLDALIPGEDVKDTFDQLLGADPNVTVILLSGFSRDYLRSQIERGAWGFVQKPLDHAALLATAQRMLAQRTNDKRHAAAATP